MARSSGKVLSLVITEAFYVHSAMLASTRVPIVLTNSFFSTASLTTISSLLTLFSKFFSSFLHSTCLLSVSHQYLALGEVYLPFWAAVPNNPTLRNTPYSASNARHGVVTLYDVPFQELMRSPHLLACTSDYNSETFPPQIFNLSFCLFTRRYWGNLC